MSENRDVYREVIHDGDDKITVIGTRNRILGVVTIAVQRGGFGSTFTLSVAAARELMSRVNEAAMAAADPSQ